VGIIRLLLAAAVVFGHSSPIFGQTLGGGVFAVDCFFVISGFYMAMVLQKRYLRLPTRQWRTFMGARLLRLMPVYLAVVLATLAVVIKLRDGSPSVTSPTYHPLPSPSSLWPMSLSWGRT